MTASEFQVWAVFWPFSENHNAFLVNKVNCSCFILIEMDNNIAQI